MIKKIIAFLLSLSLCLSAVFISAEAVESGSEAIKPDSVKISFRCGVLKGESVQLQATLSPENALMSSVEWSSSKPNVISCTPDGKIKGISAGGYADITCKAKWGNAYDKIRVYCVEPIDEYVKSDFVGLITPVYAQPGIGETVTMHFNTTFFIQYIMDILAVYFKYINSVPLGVGSSPDLAGGKCEIRGKYNSYAYIFIETENGKRDGFVKHTKLEAQTNMFLTLSAEDIDVWGNKYVNPNKKLTTPYKGEVKWSVSDESVIDFDDDTGQIKGLKPGTATITATAGNEQKTCTVHSLYRWPQTWTTATNQETYLYRAKGSGYVEAIPMPKGRSFTVYGDNGTSDGWAYGVTTIGGEDYWGYIPISHVSTKGTISQYRNLRTTLKGVRVPWIWPVRDTIKGVAQSSTATYVSSPYGWRNLGNSSMHKGIDITTGTPEEIKGYDVVSTCAGRVVYIGNKKNSVYGYCLSVRSNEKDPVTGLYYVVTYMHLDSLPVVRINDYVEANQVLGYVGNTSSSSDMGYHLHFEINCKNSPLEDGSGTRKSYDNLINPIFIFVDKCEIRTKKDKREGKIIINNDSDAVTMYRGAYWYGDNTGKENNS